LEEGALDSSVSSGAVSPEFTKLCAWIISELRFYSKLEENVHATNCKICLNSLIIAANGDLKNLTDRIISLQIAVFTVDGSHAVVHLG